ncbi:MAG: hypothetical protein ACRETN_02570 [Nevskiales bacterium]
MLMRSFGASLGLSFLTFSVLAEPENTACGLTDPAEVAGVFGGNVAAEDPGQAYANSCGYELEGVAFDRPLTNDVVIYRHDSEKYGVEKSWPGVKAGYEKHRGPLTDVPGIGDAAFNPADAGTQELVVKTAKAIFVIEARVKNAPPDFGDRINELGRRIAGRNP